MSEQSGIEIYPVGVLAALKSPRPFRARLLKRQWRYLVYQAKRGNWRAVRSAFNGYLAEWHYPPATMRHYRCGRGWTKRAALRRFGQHIAESNLITDRQDGGAGQ